MPHAVKNDRIIYLLKPPSLFIRYTIKKFQTNQINQKKKNHQLLSKNLNRILNTLNLNTTNEF